MRHTTGWRWLLGPLCLAAVLTSTLATDAAADAAGATSFVGARAQEAIAILRDPSLTAAEFQSEFRSFVEEAFDVTVVGRFAVGPYWRSASPEQRVRYQAVFLDYMVNTYAATFRRYSNERLEISGARVLGENDTLVSTAIVREAGADIAVDWHVRETRDGSYKIIDILPEGLRLGLTLRDQFSAILRAGGGDLDVLIEDLRVRTAVGEGG